MELAKGDAKIWFKTVNLRSGDQINYKYAIQDEVSGRVMWESVKGDRWDTCPCAALQPWVSVPFLPQFLTHLSH